MRARQGGIGDKCGGHSVHCPPGTCLLVPNALQSHGRGIQLHACVNCSVIVDRKVVVGRRRRHEASMRSRRPRGQEEPSLASVGCGRAAKCRVRAHPPVRDARGRPISFNHKSCICTDDSCNAPPCAVAHSRHRQHSGSPEPRCGARWQQDGATAHRRKSNLLLGSACRVRVGAHSTHTYSPSNQIRAIFRENRDTCECTRFSRLPL